MSYSPQKKGQNLLERDIVSEMILKYAKLVYLVDKLCVQNDMMRFVILKHRQTMKMKDSLPTVQSFETENSVQLAATSMVCLR